MEPSLLSFCVPFFLSEGGVKSVYDVMKTRDRGIRTYYYSSLVPLHYQVFKEIHSAKLKNLIRLVKYWKKERELVRESSGCVTF